MRERRHDVVRFRWNGNVSSSSLRDAAADLSSMIREYGSVVLVSCSLGTQIALLSGGLVRIDRIISLCGVYGHNTIPFPFIDIRSVDDHFGNLCHAFLNVFSSRSNTIGTVLLESIRHDQFGLDTTISSGSFREHRISEIIEHFLA